MHKKAAFFDRDGTLIVDVSYLSRLEDIVLLPQGVAVARWCQQQGYELFVVTNQSGVARGFFDLDFVEKTHRHLEMLLREQGIAIKQFYVCPHHPTEGVIQEFMIDCSCRKPKPGMLIQTAQEHGLDLASSLLFGDRECDFLAGRSAGCRVFDINKIDIIKGGDELWNK